MKSIDSPLSLTDVIRNMRNVYAAGLELGRRVGEATVGQPRRVAGELLAHAQPRQAHRLGQGSIAGQLFVKRAGKCQCRTVGDRPQRAYERAAAQSHQVGAPRPQTSERKTHPPAVACIEDYQRSGTP
jgi:hypothetical protein